MEERVIIYFNAPWCEVCSEFLPKIERAVEYLDVTFDLIQEGTSKYNKAVNRYAIHTLPVVVVAKGDTYKKYSGHSGLSDFLILYSDE
jgi:thioredoxin-like negative regulator of GroEL|tara:strand:+ start:3893 stop:4156 length:264 start_codon:yes stop_codon:yes gene_type:complete